MATRSLVPLSSTPIAVGQPLPFPIFDAGGRLLLFAAAATPVQALLIQLLNGFTFPAMWMAGVAYADQNAPAGMSATAQGIFGATVLGVGIAVGGFAGGPLLSSVGAHAMSLIYGVIALAIVGGVALAGSRRGLLGEAG